MAKQIKIVLVIMGYWLISISMVFTNKYLVGSQKSEEDISIFVAWIQCFVCIVTVLVYSGLVSLFQGRSLISDMSIRVCTSRHIMTLSLVFVSMLTFNNLCLKHVNIAFYQVARSLTIVFTVIFSVTILRQNISEKSMMCCGAVALGFMLGIDQENLAGTLSIYGVVFGMVTSIFIALSGIFTKRALDVVENNATCLTFYNNFNAMLLFFPLVIFTGQLESALRSDRIRDVHFWGFLLASGVMSFLMGWISALQINYTSPVTHHISANAKAVLQTVIAVMYFQEDKKPLWWLSNALIVGGALAYAVLKTRGETERDSSSECDINLGENDQNNDV